MATQLTAWWTKDRHELGPPTYGYEDRFPGAALQRQIPPGSRPVHVQRILHVRGVTQRPHSEYLLRDALFVRGAQWRWSTRQLCSALDSYGPANEVRECSQATGEFNAFFWVLFPGDFPRHWPLATESRIPATLRKLPDYLDRPCAWTRPLISARVLSSSLIDLITASCNRETDRADREPALGKAIGRNTHDVSLQRLFGNPSWNSKNKSALFFGGVGIAQIWGDTLLAIAVAFLEAARTLPQPFGIVESGNLCGASTMLIALLKRRYCPKCRFVSADPGWYRLVRKQKMTCAADMLTWAGLRDEVRLQACAKSVAWANN